MGNGATSKIIGIETIKIKMFDGIMKALENLRHVPDIKMNLISQGILDSEGFTSKEMDEALTVVKGAMIAMKGNKQDSLYTLLGNTIIDRQQGPPNRAAGRRRRTSKTSVGKVLK